MKEKTQKRSFCEWARQEYRITKLLFRSTPSIAVAIFVVTVVVMNLMANKTIYRNDWLVLNGGVLVSWIPFLTMDILTKHFGARAANRLSILAIFVNLFCCLIFYLVSIIESNPAFDSIFHGTWFILIGSTIAFVLSAITNNYSNELIGRLFKKNPDGRFAYFVRAYVSTLVGQIIDNLMFAMPTFMLFAPIVWGPEYGWTFVQCLMCSVLCALFELVIEGLFTPIGYRINKKWKEEKVGEEYLELVNEGKQAWRED